MAGVDIGEILITPGRLCHTPTDLTTAWPHGGTGLGTVKEIAIRPVRNFETIKEEAFGQEVIDVINFCESWVLACIIRTLDDDALGKLFPTTYTGTSSARKGLAYPGSFRAGTLGSDSSFKLLFTPDDPDRHPWFYFPNVIAMVEESAEIKLENTDELTYPAVFYATRDSSARVMVMGRKGDITL